MNRAQKQPDSYTAFANGVNCFTGKPVGTPEVKRKHPPQSDQMIADVRTLHAQGVPRKVLAAKYNVSRWTIYNIINRKKTYEKL